MAAIAPHDKNVHIVGSDDSTTCIIVVVRHSGRFACNLLAINAIILVCAGSGAVAMAHLDGNGTDEAVTAMVGLCWLNLRSNVKFLFLIRSPE